MQFHLEDNSSLRELVSRARYMTEDDIDARLRELILPRGGSWGHPTRWVINGHTVVGDFDSAPPHNFYSFLREYNLLHAPKDSRRMNGGLDVEFYLRSGSTPVLLRRWIMDSDLDMFVWDRHGHPLRL